LPRELSDRWNGAVSAAAYIGEDKPPQLGNTEVYEFSESWSETMTAGNSKKRTAIHSFVNVTSGLPPRYHLEILAHSYWKCLFIGENGFFAVVADILEAEDYIAVMAGLEMLWYYSSGQLPST
jgi:hypothetical protein